MKALRCFGGLALVALIAGAAFVVGARFGARTALEAVAAKVAQAKAARAKPPERGTVPPNPDPSIIASPVTPLPGPGPQSGMIRRVVGDRVVSDEPVSTLSQTASPEVPE